MSWLSNLLGGAAEDEENVCSINHDADNAAHMSSGAVYLEQNGAEVWVTTELHHAAENAANNAADQQGNQAG